MKNEKKNNRMLVGILIGIVITLLVVGGLFATGTIGFKTSKTSDNGQNSENNQEEKINSTVKQENNNYEDYEQKLDDGTTIKYTFEKNNNYVSKVDVDDTYAFNAMHETGINTFVLKDGKVYYHSESCQNKENCVYYSKSSNKKEWKEYSAPSNIKRIKSGNFFSSGVDFSIILITEDGKLISGKRNYETGDFNFESFDQSNELSKYKIDNILEWGGTAGPGLPTWKVVLKDGTILTKTVN